MPLTPLPFCEQNSPPCVGYQGVTGSAASIAPRRHPPTHPRHTPRPAPPLPLCPGLQGGLKLFLSALRQHAHLVRSAEDPQTYLVNDIADPLQRSLHSLELTDVLLGGPPHGASSTFAPPAGEWVRRPGRPSRCLGSEPAQLKCLGL